MPVFVDPRTVPNAIKAPGRTTTIPAELADLHSLYRASHLYEVERWIKAGRPLQATQLSATKRGNLKSALAIALETAFSLGASTAAGLRSPRYVGCCDSSRKRTGG